MDSLYNFVHPLVPPSLSPNIILGHSILIWEMYF